MAPPVLSLRDVQLRFGAAPLFDGLSLNVAADERACLIGRNGAGKSTLLRLLAGVIEADGGSRFLQPGVRVAYLAQEPAMAGAGTVADYAGRDAGERAYRVPMLLSALGLDGDQPLDTLSGGQARRTALAQVLVQEPDVLLLDEPTNHLDIRAIEWLEQELARFGGAVVSISHDRRFLANTTRAVWWLDGGRLRRSDEGFAQVEAWQEKLIAQETREREQLDKLIAAETRWSHAGITARRRRNQGRLRRLQDLRAERRRLLSAGGQARLEADSGRLSGKRVIEAEHIAKAYDGQAVIADFSTRVLRGDRVGLIGANGAGKTTLLRMLTGQLAPDSGRVRLGSNLQTVYLDQQRAMLAPEASVQDVLCPAGGAQVIVGGEARHVASYLQQFLFDPAQARQPVSALSGGERNRLLLARALAQPANLLVLDEPTNDLDMDTLDLLQEMLADYDGTLLLVSHDRDFLDRVVTSTIALEGDGRPVEYAGGYSDYLAQRGTAAPAAQRAKKPKPAPAPAARASRKLSYHQQRRLDALPEEMAALQAEIAELETTLADPGLFRREPDGFATATARLEAAQETLATAEEEWLELELLREQLAG